MKLLINLAIILVSFAANAGGSSGGGVGPRPGMEFMTVSPGDVALGSTSGGGGGPRPEDILLGVNGGGTGPRPNIDFVKAESINQNTITFKYRPFDTGSIQIHKIQTNELNDTFRMALEKSLQSQKWESIKIEQ